MPKAKISRKESWVGMIPTFSNRCGEVRQYTSPSLPHQAPQVPRQRRASVIQINSLTDHVVLGVTIYGTGLVLGQRIPGHLIFKVKHVINVLGVTLSQLQYSFHL